MRKRPLFIATWIFFVLTFLLMLLGIAIFLVLCFVGDVSDFGILIIDAQMFVIPLLSVVNIILGCVLFTKSCLKKEETTGNVSIVAGVLGIPWTLAWWLLAGIISG
jgi:hypothetical protein